METVASGAFAVKNQPRPSPEPVPGSYPGPLPFLALAQKTCPCMTLCEYAALTALVVAADNGSGLCHPKIETIAACAKMSYGAAHAAVHGLHDLGWLRLTSRRPKGSKTQDTNLYQLTVAEHDAATCDRCEGLAAKREERRARGLAVASSRRRGSGSTRDSLHGHAPVAGFTSGRGICSPDPDLTKEERDQRMTMPSPDRDPAPGHDSDKEGPITLRTPKEPTPASKAADPVVNVRTMDARGQMTLTADPVATKPRSGTRRKATEAGVADGEIHKAIIACYAEEYERVFGRKAAIGSRDAKGAKELRAACGNDAEWACKIIRDAFQNDWFLRNPSLHCIGNNPNGFTPSAPAHGASSRPSSSNRGSLKESTARVLRYFIAVRSKRTGNTPYDTPEKAPQKDRYAAASLWADAERMADERCTAEDCVRYWIACYFKDGGKAAEEGYPITWMASRIGTYGSPKRADGSAGAMSEGSVIGVGGRVYRKVNAPPPPITPPSEAPRRAPVPIPMPQFILDDQQRAREARQDVTR